MHKTQSAANLTPLSGVVLSYCKKVTQKIYDTSISEFFREPVDVKSIPGYSEKIKHPMDLSTVLKKLNSNQYSSVDKWKEDMNLIWINATNFNGPDTPAYVMAKQLQSIFKGYTEKIPRNEFQAWAFKMSHEQEKLLTLLSQKPGPPEVLKSYVPNFKLIFTI